MGVASNLRAWSLVLLRRLLQRPVKLCYPLDGFVGYFPRAYARRPPEVHYVNQVVEHIRRHFVCFDVGAYLGYYTLLFARFAREVHAFEPLPPNLRVLRKNVRLNRLENVRVHALAAGSSEGGVQIRANVGIDSMASVLRPGGASQFSVRQTALDAFCAGAAAYPDLVKIDVEGYEGEVFKGMRDVLARKRPILLLEVHSSYLRGHEIDEMFGTLRGLGYRVFSWLEDVEPGGHGFWRHMAEVAAARDLRVGATLALPT